MTEAEKDPEYVRRKGLTFAQAEGVSPLPSQLKTKEVSQQLKSVMWALLIDAIDKTYSFREYHLDGRWTRIMRDFHFMYLHKPVDEFNNDYDTQISLIKNLIWSHNYVDFFGFLQFVLSHDQCPNDLHESVETGLRYGRAAYTVVGESVIIPISTEEEGRTLTSAINDATQAGLKGSRQHLINAASFCTAGNFADSIRESIHALESAAREIGGSSDFATAMATLERAGSIHPSLKQGFVKIYGFTSDEKGIRHALQDANSKVDQADALFMIGACAAFLSYMVAKTRQSS